jgi:hypothetical protein
MTNLFDGLRNLVVKTVANVMGYTATWQPSNGGSLVTATVLYNTPTEAFTENGNEYEPYDFAVEYTKNDFVGLKALVDQNTLQEVITITVNGQQEKVLVRKVQAKFDGFTLIAYGDKYTENV